MRRLFLFGGFCRLRVRACHCAGSVIPSSLLKLCLMASVHNRQSRNSITGFNLHRIALAPIIIAQTARIQPQGAL